MPSKHGRFSRAGSYLVARLVQSKVRGGLTFSAMLIRSLRRTVGFAKVPSPRTDDLSAFVPPFPQQKGALEQQFYDAAPDNYRTTMMHGMPPPHEVANPSAGAQALQRALSVGPIVQEGMISTGSEEAPRPNSSEMHLLVTELSGPHDSELAQHLEAVTGGCRPLITIALKSCTGRTLHASGLPLIHPAGHHLGERR
jgi:hypothetical protein